MKALSILASATALAALLGTSAAAQTPLSDFEAFCVATASEPDAVAKAAGARGWFPVDAPEGFDFQHVMAAPHQSTMLFWGEESTTISRQAVAIRNCSVAADASGAALATATSAWLRGAEPEVNRHGNPEWAFALDAGRTRIPDLAAYSEEQVLFVLRQRPIALLAINEGEGSDGGKGKPLSVLALTVYALR